MRMLEKIDHDDVDCMIITKPIGSTALWRRNEKNTALRRQLPIAIALIAGTIVLLFSSSSTLSIISKMVDYNNDNIKDG